MSIVEITKEKIIIKLYETYDKFNTLIFGKGELSSVRIHRTSTPNKPMNITREPMFILHIKEKTRINIESSNYGFVEHHLERENKILHLKLIKLKV